MKKLVLMFAAVAAISFASCDNAAKTEAPAEDRIDTVDLDNSTKVAYTIAAAGDTLSTDTIKVEATTEEKVEAPEATTEENTEAETPAEEKTEE